MKPLLLSVVNKRQIWGFAVVPIKSWAFPANLNQNARIQCFQPALSNSDHMIPDIKLEGECECDSSEWVVIKKNLFIRLDISSGP